MLFKHTLIIAWRCTHLCTHSLGRACTFVHIRGPCVRARRGGQMSKIHECNKRKESGNAYICVIALFLMCKRGYIRCVCRGEKEAVFSVVAGFDHSVCVFVCACASRMKHCASIRDSQNTHYSLTPPSPHTHTHPTTTPLVRSLPGPLTTIL